MPVQKKKNPPQTPGGPFSFTFEEFAVWYGDLTVALLEPARQAFVRILGEMLDAELSDVDRLRFRVSHSRIKGESRLWNKMLLPKYAPRITTLQDIPNVVDDIVGVRVTCNNLIDVETFRNIIIGLAPFDSEETLPAGLCIDTNSERQHNKDSGYRAYHINLHTLVPHSGGWKPARGELQVRTLLQDSWGELTHEDTYKPGSSMPNLVTKFAKRMADLLATVDDLAQDLRSELDSLAQQDAEDEPEALDTRTEQDAEPRPPSPPLEENVRDALISEARRVVESLTRPASLAQVAWQVQADFGREVTVNWGGFGTFKALLMEAVPTVQIIDVPPGTVVPAAVARSTAEELKSSKAQELAAAGVPAVIQRLRGHDSGVPAVSVERLGVLIRAIATALEPETWERLGLSAHVMGIRELNQLTKYARSLDDGSDGFPSKLHIDYLLKTLFFSQNLRPGLRSSDIAGIAVNYLFARASRLGLVADVVSERAELEEWFEDAI